MKEITAVTLFNGAGGLLMALKELNIPIKALYVSEIDKFANKAADLLYDKNIHLGCVTTLRRATCWNLSTLIKAFNSKYLSDETKERLAVAMDLRGKVVDILTCGFPCQAWSLAGKQQGDNDPRGALIHDMLGLWAYMRNINPDIKFMFENVAMKKEFMTYINKLFERDPVKINSALLVPQNRDRNYWSNWEVNQPKDTGSILLDILERGSINGHTLSEAAIARILRKKYSNPKVMPEKTGTINTKNNSGQLSIDGGTTLIPMFRHCDLRENAPVFLDWMDDTKNHGGTLEEYNRLYKKPLCHHVATATDIKSNESNKRIYDVTGKCPTLTTMGGGHREPKFYMGHNLYRKATPLECMMLQGWPQWVIDILLNSGISNSQLYKMVGNGWTHPVIVHILRCLLNTGWMQNCD